MTYNLRNEIQKLEQSKLNIHVFIEAGLKKIDRILWDFDEDCLKPPEKYTLYEYRVFEDVLDIVTRSGYQGGDYHYFSVPIVYFDDKEAYDRALAKALKELKSDKDLIDKIKVDQAFREKEIIKASKAAQLKKLLAEKERGEF